MESTASASQWRKHDAHRTSVAGVCLRGGGCRPGRHRKGQKEEQRACLPCHSLRIVHSNRLSRAGWNKELDKMAGWGVKYTDRDAILEYLVATYGDDKPVTAPEMSADGRAKQQ